MNETITMTTSEAAGLAVTILIGIGLAFLAGFKYGLAPLKKIQNLIDIQCSHGNWNYDPYMHGLANGLIMIKSVMLDLNPSFLEAPSEWLCDKGKNKLQEGVRVLVKELREDTDYRHSWFCNIAMSFKDAYSHEVRRSATIPDVTNEAFINRISEQGADYFLNILTHESSPSDEELPGMLKLEKVQKGEL